MIFTCIYGIFSTLSREIMDFYSTDTEPFNFLTAKPPEKGKRLFLYQNGHDKMFKTFVYNSRNVRDFSSFLNQVTFAVDAPIAIRNIYTPHEGHRVKDSSGQS